MSSETAKIISETVSILRWLFSKTVVKGIITTPDNHPLSQAEIHIGNLQNTAALNGKFIIEGLATGVHSISVAHNGKTYKHVDQIYIRRGAEINVNINIDITKPRESSNSTKLETADQTTRVREVLKKNAQEYKPKDIHTTNNQRVESSTPSAQNSELQMFMYPVKNEPDEDWTRDMLNAWRNSEKTYLSFPFARYFPQQLAQSVKNDEPFWIYMYYTAKSGSLPYKYGGQVRFRIRAVNWSQEPHTGENIFLLEFPAEWDETIWFLCDEAQELKNKNKNWLTIDDFSHPEGKKLYATLRTTMPPVTLNEEIDIIQRFPNPS